MAASVSCAGMDRRRIVVAEPIAPAGIALLEEEFDVVDAAGVARSTLMEHLGDAAALIVRSATKVDEELLRAAPNLEVIGRAGIGVDNIDLDEATSRGIMVVNAPNANTISAAEHTLALILAQARRIPEADASLKAGRWERKRFQGIELHGKTLGILGLGKIGSLVAQRARAFGMRVLAYDPYVSDERARRLDVEPVDFDTLLAESDILTIHLPKTAETEGILSRAALAKTKPGVRIVNVARGGLVDEEALAEAIESGRVAGAALDVFATEPPERGRLFELDAVVVTPHLGASTREAQDKAGIAVAEAVADALRGELVPSAVNLDLGPEVPEEVRPFLRLAEGLGRIFVGFARGLPAELTVAARGRLAREPVRPVALAAMKGALGAVTEQAVSYVNAPHLAEAHGMLVREEAEPTTTGYESVVRLSGDVGLRERVIAGTVLGHKGPVLVEVDGYRIELPITEHLLLLRNADVPGMIGKVGTVLGEAGVNIADMVVGRSPTGEDAMMGLSLDRPLTDEELERLLGLDGVLAARFVDLSSRGG